MGTLIGGVFEYPVPAEGAPPPATSRVLPWAEPPSVLNNGSARKRRMEIGFVGTGNYASSVLLPHLAKLSTVGLAHVGTTKSLSAANVQRVCG